MFYPAENIEIKNHFDYILIAFVLFLFRLLFCNTFFFWSKQTNSTTLARGEFICFCFFIFLG